MASAEAITAEGGGCRAGGDRGLAGSHASSRRTIRSNAWARPAGCCRRSSAHGSTRLRDADAFAERRRAKMRADLGPLGDRAAQGFREDHVGHLCLSWAGPSCPLRYSKSLFTSCVKWYLLAARGVHFGARRAGEFTRARGSVGRGSGVIAGGREERLVTIRRHPGPRAARPASAAPQHGARCRCEYGPAA